MKTCRLLLLAIPLVTMVASAQDSQDCGSHGSYSFKDIKDSVHRVTGLRIYQGWDTKIFNRSGDLVSIAILQTLSDAEMTSPETLKDVLMILRAAFACARPCVSPIGDRQPRVTLLLLEHLRTITRGKMRAEIDETRTFILAQGR
jgi:hypothetical protein